MIIRSLSLNNFGVFKGTHTFKFIPFDSDGSRKNITIVTGPNGSGKSTIFLGFRLALFGRRALTGRISQENYRNFLGSIIHRNKEDSTSAGVTIVISLILSGNPVILEINRSWRLGKRNIKEKLSIIKDGEPLDLDDQDYQSWINTVLPPSITEISFFDAENLGGIIDSSADSWTFERNLRRLLGLDIVDQLRKDISQFILSNSKLPKKGEQERNLNNHREVIKKLDVEIDALKSRESNFEERISQTESKVAQIKDDLASEGGDFVKRRIKYERKLERLSTELAIYTEEIIQLSAELLPFTLCPSLCRSLFTRIESERITQELEAAGRILENQSKKLIEEVESDEFLGHLHLKNKEISSIRNEIQKLVIRIIAEAGPESQTPIHRLPTNIADEVRSWIRTISDISNVRIPAIRDKFVKLQKSRSRVLSNLENVPDEATLADMIMNLSKLEAQRDQDSHELKRLNQNLRSLEFKKEEEERLLSKVIEAIDDIESTDRRIVLAQKSVSVLRTYQEALLQQRIESIETNFMSAFNQVCRKEHFLEKVELDGKSLTLRMYRREGDILDIREFSKAELHLYALALLRTLRQSSGLDLPLAIDTPFARLDELHRWRIINQYLPRLANQVMIFLTDSEYNDMILVNEVDSVARTYRLQFNDDLGETGVEEITRATNAGTILYRRRSAKGNGHLWLNNLAHQHSTNGLTKAILPSTAKRLVLVDPIGGKPIWENIKILQKLVGNKTISAKVRDGEIFSQFWLEDDWDAPIQKAGYESIAFSADEGPVEYVLNPTILQPFGKKMIEGYADA